MVNVKKDLASQPLLIILRTICSFPAMCQSKIYRDSIPPPWRGISQGTTGSLNLSANSTGSKYWATVWKATQFEKSVFHKGKFKGN